MYSQPYYAPIQYPYFQNIGDYKSQNIQQMGNIPQQPLSSPVSNYAPKNDMIWVLNESEAAAYPVAPNASVVLWDKNNPILYIKSANLQGVPSMRIIDYVERTENAQDSVKTHSSSFATLEQFKTIEGEINALKTRLDKITEPTEEKTRKGGKDNG